MVFFIPLRNETKKQTGVVIHPLRLHDALD